MAKCRWNDCQNEATTVVYRLATDEEQEASEFFNGHRSTRTALLETIVCDEHLQEAQKIYPMIANKEPK